MLVKPSYCIDCKYFRNTSYEGSCYREGTVDLVFGITRGTYYSCYQERGYDATYLLTYRRTHHEICGVEAKFFEAKQ